MAELDFNTLYNQLQSEIQGLFSSKQKFNAPAGTPSASRPSENVIHSAEGFVPPIHGAWHNLGGFDQSMVRFDDPKGAKKGRGHMGVDMGAAAGTAVYAVAPGIVNSVGTDDSGGNIVGVQHDNNLWTYYAHLSTAKVQKGDKVDSNTIVGTVGNTGNPGNPKDKFVTQEGGRTWPHLHFGVKEHGGWVNPARFMSIPKYDPDYAKNPAKYQNFWVSEEAKQEAQAFNMKKHLAERKVAFSKEVSKLLKLASRYCDIIDQSK